VNLVDLTDAVKVMTPPAGWHFTFEYPGTFTFRHDTGAVVHATPDWECVDAIAIVAYKSAEAAECGGQTTLTIDHPWPVAGRSPESYLAAMAPYLAAALDAGGGAA